MVEVRVAVVGKSQEGRIKDMLVVRMTSKEVVKE